ncbi:hypothetical protein EPUL_003997 [Erysiphe pulchra]|uniref:Uncharacterized protein n=1 Tax=Erysiphe pulchra TaxID=225359 RepID=A0A2S4PSJ9_9PEZI|nr:hypothetical protein EPUL_003997 [Erysiphe pulchra]
MPPLKAKDLGGDLGMSSGISARLAGCFFVLEIEGISWLETWRQTRVYYANIKYVSLDVMMFTMRKVAKRHEVVNFAQIAMATGANKRKGNGRNEGDINPEAISEICKHKHRNKNCFKQHPELRSCTKNKCNARAAFENTNIDFSSDSDGDSDCVGLRSIALNNSDYDSQYESEDSDHELPHTRSSIKDSEYGGCHGDGFESSDQCDHIRNRELTRQEEQSELIVSDQNEKYDQVMTGWDPIPQLAGTKRSRSPEQEVTPSKRGRQIKKIDYYKLHHGKVVNITIDLKTWTEAISGSEAKE